MPNDHYLERFKVLYEQNRAKLEEARQLACDKIRNLPTEIFDAQHMYIKRLEKRVAELEEELKNTNAVKKQDA